MGSVVTRTVADFQLVFGHPALGRGWVCRCGQPLLRLTADAPSRELACGCGLRYALRDGAVAELSPPLER